MHPVFEEALSGSPGQVLQRLARIGAEPREQGKVMGPGQDVDRVHLQDTQTPDHAEDVVQETLLAALEGLSSDRTQAQGAVSECVRRSMLSRASE